MQGGNFYKSAEEEEVDVKITNMAYRRLQFIINRNFEELQKNGSRRFIVQNQHRFPTNIQPEEGKVPKKYY